MYREEKRHLTGEKQISNYFLKSKGILIDIENAIYIVVIPIDIK